uniref:Uncharacterized protein n=1 Tax=Trichuris muris TaxID=70415 RepID=A0A5S6QJG4_TRIMR
MVGKGNTFDPLRPEKRRRAAAPKGDRNALSCCLMELFFDFDATLVYKQCVLEPHREEITPKNMEIMINLHQAPELKHDLLGSIAVGTAVMLIGNNVGPEFAKRWVLARALTIFQVYNKEWKEEYASCLLSESWAKGIDTLWDGSLEFRSRVFTGAVREARGTEAVQRLFWYVELMLKFARLSGFSFIRQFVVLDTAHPIHWDPYLQVDRARFHDAVTTWKNFPDEIKLYAGIFAGPESFYRMGGDQLRRLMYIAVQIGRRTVETFRDCTCVPPPDAAKCDRLIEKYFPPEAQACRAAREAQPIAAEQRLHEDYSEEQVAEPS